MNLKINHAYIEEITDVGFPATWKKGKNGRTPEVQMQKRKLSYLFTDNA